MKIPKSAHLSPGESTNRGHSRENAQALLLRARQRDSRCRRRLRCRRHFISEKKWDIVLAEFARRCAVEPNPPESFFREVGRNSLKHQKIYVLADVAAKIARRNSSPERPWDRRRPSRTIYKPAVPTNSPGSLSFSSPFAAARRLPFCGFKAPDSLRRASF